MEEVKDNIKVVSEVVKQTFYNKTEIDEKLKNLKEYVTRTLKTLEFSIKNSGGNSGSGNEGSGIVLPSDTYTKKEVRDLIETVKQFVIESIEGINIQGETPKLPDNIITSDKVYSKRETDDLIRNIRNKVNEVKDELTELIDTSIDNKIKNLPTKIDLVKIKLELEKIKKQNNNSNNTGNTGGENNSNISDLSQVFDEIDGLKNNIDEIKRDIKKNEREIKRLLSNNGSGSGNGGSFSEEELELLLNNKYYTKTQINNEIQKLDNKIRNIQSNGNVDIDEVTNTVKNELKKDFNNLKTEIKNNQEEKINELKNNVYNKNEVYSKLETNTKISTEIDKINKDILEKLSNNTDDNITIQNGITGDDLKEALKNYYTSAIIDEKLKNINTNSSSINMENIFEEVYSKTEINEKFYDKKESDKNYYRKSYIEENYCEKSEYYNKSDIDKNIAKKTDLNKINEDIDSIKTLLSESGNITGDKVDDKIRTALREYYNKQETDDKFNNAIANATIAKNKSEENENVINSEKEKIKKNVNDIKSLEQKNLELLNKQSEISSNISEIEKRYKRKDEEITEEISNINRDLKGHKESNITEFDEIKEKINTIQNKTNNYVTNEQLKKDIKDINQKIDEVLEKIKENESKDIDDKTELSLKILANTNKFKDYLSKTENENIQSSINTLLSTMDSLNKKIKTIEEEIKKLKNPSV